MHFKRHEKNGIVYYTSPLFDKYDIPHFFAARRGGVSDGDFSSLNISMSRKNKDGQPDELSRVRENVRRGLELTNSGENSASMMSQIHSAKVCRAEVSCEEYFSCNKAFQECDGLYAEKGMNINTLCVKTADCVPVLLYDIKNDIGCAVHAGWRGSVSDICGNAVRAMSSNCGTSEIVAAIGPCIGSCCYEVNDKVYDAALDFAVTNGIDKNLVEKCFVERYFADRENKYKIHLPNLNALYLKNAGIKDENISICELCTCCHKDEKGAVFFSHRASNGHSGTQMSAVSLRM